MTKKKTDPAKLDDDAPMLVALLALEATDGAPNRVEVAVATAERIGLDAGQVNRVRALADDGDVYLWSGIHRPNAPTEPAVRPLAAHLEASDRARASYLITALRRADEERWEHERLAELYGMVQDALGDD